MEILKEEEQKYIDEIVKKIVSEVLKKVYEKEILEKEEKGNKEEKSEDILIVFTGGTGSLDSVLEGLKKLREKYKLFAVFSEASKQVLPIKEFKENIQFEEIVPQNLYKVINESKLVILPTLTQNTAAKIAYGIRDTIASEAAAVSIIAGKKILACEDSIPCNSMPEEYSKLIKSILQTLKNFGIRFCRAENIFDEVENINGSDEIVCKKKEKTAEKEKTEISMDLKLITGETIQKLYKEGIRKIILPNKCIITPSAKDMIKDYKITIEWMVK